MNSIRAFRKLSSSTPDLNKVQENVELALEPLLISPIVDGVLLPTLQLLTGENVVNHKLGRKPQGWILVAPQANETVWQLAADKNVLTLEASGNITTSLWVF